jgi:NAD dependent epimerase/dehydratase family enzyme
MKTLVTGGTGMVGPRLLRMLDQPVILSRNPERAREKVGHLVGRIIRWDPMAGPPPAEAFAGVEAVFHLAGESVAEGRWTAAQNARIRDSRVVGTRNLVQGIAQVSDRPRVLVSASAVGYYGSSVDARFDEASASGGDFLAEICLQWEAAADRAPSGCRLVKLRLGIVATDLDSGAGVLFERGDTGQAVRASSSVPIGPSNTVSIPET